MHHQWWICKGVYGLSHSRTWPRGGVFRGFMSINLYTFLFSSFKWQKAQPSRPHIKKWMSIRKNKIDLLISVTQKKERTKAGQHVSPREYTHVDIGGWETRSMKVREATGACHGAKMQCGIFHYHRPSAASALFVLLSASPTNYPLHHFPIWLKKESRQVANTWMLVAGSETRKQEKVKLESCPLPPAAEESGRRAEASAEGPFDAGGST